MKIPPDKNDLQQRMGLFRHSVIAPLLHKPQDKTMAQMLAERAALTYDIPGTHRTQVAVAKLYTGKTPLTAADLLNDRVMPLFEAKGVLLQRILTDRGTEYCGRHDEHPYQLYLAINDIDHTRTKVKSPQTNGICERFHRTILQEFYQVAFRKKLYTTIDDIQKDLDAWLFEYNVQRSHQGKMCCGRTPMQTFDDGIKIWKAKVIGDQAA